MRHRRQGGDVAGAPRASTSRCTRSSTPSSAGPPSAWARRRAASARTSPGATARRPVAVQPGRGPGRRRVRSHPTPRLSRGRRAARGLAITERKPEWLRANVRHRARVPAPEAHDARPRPRHRVRGGRLPQHLRVLGRRHRHVHDQRRALHAGVRLLPRRHPPSRRRPTPASPSGWPKPSPAWACAHAVVTAWPATTSPTAARRRSPRPSEAIRRRNPGCAVEVLVPDCKGDPASRRRRVAARPDVLNHNIETVARLQRAVRPSAGYARSLAVLARAKAAGLTDEVGPRSSGMGETDAEVEGDAGRPGRQSASTSSRSASTCARPRTTCRSPGGSSPPTFERLEGRRRGAGHRPRRGLAADPLELPRPPGGHCGRPRLPPEGRVDHFGDSVTPRRRSITLTSGMDHQ